MSRRDRSAPSASLAPLARDDGPVFAQPWEAQALAMAVRLQEAGHFTADEWATALGAAIRAAQAAGDPDDGSTYYRHVLAALEALIETKGLCDATALAARKEAWIEAYQSTPHGLPVKLADEEGEPAG